MSNTEIQFKHKWWLVITLFTLAHLNHKRNYATFGLFFRETFALEFKDGFEIYAEFFKNSVFNTFIAKEAGRLIFKHFLEPIELMTLENKSCIRENSNCLWSLYKNTDIVFKWLMHSNGPEEQSLYVLVAVLFFRCELGQGSVAVLFSLHSMLHLLPVARAGENPAGSEEMYTMRR